MIVIVKIDSYSEPDTQEIHLRPLKSTNVSRALVVRVYIKYPNIELDN